jgi:inorganic pyrophosphatase
MRNDKMKKNTSKFKETRQGLVDPTNLKPFTKKSAESTTGTAEAGDKYCR